MSHTSWRAINPHILCCLLFGLIVGLWHNTPVTAHEFRVDTAVYQQGSPQPLSRNTTYFTRTHICDVMEATGSAKATVLLIDRQADAATILEENQQIACTVSLEETLRTVAAITTRAHAMPRLVQFAATPTFQVQWSDDGKQLQLTAEPMSYEVRLANLPGGVADQMQFALDYQEFADWSARISATQRRGLPPTARLELNDKLARKGGIPARVEMTRITDEGKKVTFYSTHQFQWHLTNADHEQIAAWQNQVAERKTVDLVTLQFGEDATRTVEANLGKKQRK